MTLYVRIDHNTEGKVKASLIGWDELTAEGATEQEALEQLRHEFRAQMGHSKIVPFEPPGTANPWLDLAGVFKNDPFADEFDAVIEANRLELDAGQEAA